MGNKNTKKLSFNDDYDEFWQEPSASELKRLEENMHKIHNIIEETETQYYIDYIQNIKNTLDDIIIINLGKRLSLPNTWHLMDEPGRSKLFRRYIYSNQDMTNWHKYLIPVIEKMDLEEIWSLYTFFCPDAERCTHFFDELENYDGWLQSWKWEIPIHQLQHSYYHGRSDVKHLFGNIELMMRDKIIKNKSYYLKN